MRRLIPSLLVPALLAAIPAAAQAAPRWERAKETIQCTDDTGSSPFYPGKSASAVYDTTFSAGPALPPAMLDGYVPQGLGAWNPGAATALLLQAAYNDDTDRAVLAGITPSGVTQGIVTLLGPGGQGPVNAHVGGVAVSGPWLFVTGGTKNGKPIILKYSVGSAVEYFAKLSREGAPGVAGELKAVGQQTLNAGTPGFAASFLAADGATVWAGTFDAAHRNRMYQFTVNAKGRLKRVGGAGNWIQVPKKTQGLAVQDGHFLFSTSYTSKARSNVYVVRRGKKFLDQGYPQDVRCFAAPSMSQGLAVAGGQLYMSFESGSFRYRGDACDKPILERDCTRNIVTNLHLAPLTSLTS